MTSLIPTRRPAVLAVAGLAVLACALTSCAKSAGGGGGGTTGAVNDTANAQQTQSATGTASGAACTYSKYAGGVPKIDPSKIKVGFSQSESTSNPFRATETKSIETEAKSEGVTLIERNANADVSTQNSQIQDMIAQGVQFLIVAPENSDGLAPSLAAAKAKKIPVLTIDRTVTGTACSDFVAFIGSDFEGQAKIAADDLGGALGSGGGDVVVLQGTPGNNVTTARTNGFNAEIKAKYPKVKIVASQTANFDQTQGQKLMSQLLQSNPNIKGVYAENDGMALGAIQAIRAAGKKPGSDIKIVSIDGIRQIVQDVAAGTVVADVETNPRFGPLAFGAIKNFYGTTGVNTPVIIKDNHFTKANAAEALKNGQVY